MKKCIVHIPNELHPEMASASQIRPKKMINAFRSIGYDVRVVQGSSARRKESIKRIKEEIREGARFDFCYSESSTMPTLLTDSHHLPLHPFLDFGFFRFLKKNGVSIGIFYRDMYWMFPLYRKHIKWLKRVAAISMYKYDLKQYNALADVVYTPTTGGFQFIKSELPNVSLMTLPPGCEDYKKNEKTSGRPERITLLYIGGFGESYQIKKVFEAIRGLKDIGFIFCCRRDEWERERRGVEYLVTDNISIVHKQGSELEELYSCADIGVLLLKADTYRKIAMPYKTFEYISHGLPIIAVKDTAAGDLINENNLGWTISYSVPELKSLLNTLLTKQSMIDEKSQATDSFLKTNRWEDRARKVAEDLSTINQCETIIGERCSNG